MWHADIPIEYRNQIVTGDARVLSERISDESVDLIFTDPPYPKEFLYCYDILAELAVRTLCHNALCVTYSGNNYLPDVMSRLKKLSFFWIGWINHPSSQQRYWPKKVWCGGKPLLFYSRESMQPQSWICDTSTSRRDKRYHAWGQSASTAAYYIEHLTSPGQTVLDPFTGGGTVPAVCKMLGRNYIAFEIDPQTAQDARDRVEMTQPPLFVQEPEQLGMAL